ncbi:hypothetical protein [Prosthecobacter sp.]|uniref:hypothetical protein n=1 Tax=Prosthecobacter sp. TaxID=1965333 RepID=UPI0037852232
MKPGLLFMICCVCAVFLTGCCTVYSLSQLSPQQIATRNSALRRGQLPPQNLWLKYEYDAYWDGHEYGGEDFWEPLPYSPARHQHEFSTAAQTFYRNGYSKGWAEAKAEAIADGNDPHSSGGSSSSGSSRPRSSSSSRNTRPADSPPPSSPTSPGDGGSSSGGNSGGRLIIPRRF